MTVAWDLLDQAQVRCNKYAGMVGQARGTATVAIMDLQDGDVEAAIARLQKLMDDIEAAFPPFDMSTLGKAS